MKKYILLYGDKKEEDNICITNMFENNKKINLGWTDFDYSYNMKIIEEQVQEGVEQIIFMGLEIGWDRLLKEIKSKYNKLKIKVICNTLDSLLYYDYERNNFFKMLELEREGIIDNIAFLRKGQYKTYSSLGYKCSYITENYNLEKKIECRKVNDMINIGIYPLNYTWDKNIFNQLCIMKFIDNSILNYNNLDNRMPEFLETMEIESNPEKINIINEENIINAISKNDVIIETAFTEYMHPIFWISMELGIPCLIGNNSELFDEEYELKKYIVTDAEDNPIENSKKVINMLKNKDRINELYLKWKKSYNVKAEERIKKFIEI